MTYTSEEIRSEETFRVTIHRAKGPELREDPECYFCDADEAVSLLDAVLTSEVKWPHTSKLLTIEVATVAHLFERHPRSMFPNVDPNQLTIDQALEDEPF